MQWPGSIVPVLDLASRRCDDRLVVWLLDNLKEITIALFRVWNAWKGLAVQTSNCCLHLNLICHYNQNEGQSHNMKIDNSSFERVEDFKYLGTTLTNQNSIQEDIKSKLKPGNACYHSAQNLLSSSLLSKNIKIKIIQNCNLACCFLWVQNLVTHIDVGWGFWGWHLGLRGMR